MNQNVIIVQTAMMEKMKVAIYKILLSDYVGSGGNEVSEVLSEMYSSTNFNWSTDSQNVSHFEYTATLELKCLPNGDRPIDYFNLLATNKLLDILIDETNIYAIEIFLNSVSGKSRTSNWVNTNRLEMKTFLSLLFHMGTIKIPRIEDYWETYKLFNLPFFRTYVSRNRFTILLRALHFSRNPVERESIPRNRLHKIQPIVNYFNSRMNEIFEPTKNLSLDESMCSAFSKIITKKNFVTGILRSNRKHNPRKVIAQNLKKGESICRYTEDNICAVKWKDKRDVLTISSEFPHSMIIEIEIC
ncbi:hypothetical protein QTP88_025907 [Uroleucon formosanum]